MGALESFNPATGELLGTVETISPEQVQAVGDHAAEVQPFWAQLSLTDRGFEAELGERLAAIRRRLGADPG